MPKIEEWLQSVGLEKYIPAFEAAEIDFETLSEINEEDLKELGLPIGPGEKRSRPLQPFTRVTLHPKTLPNHP